MGFSPPPPHPLPSFTVTHFVSWSYIGPLVRPYLSHILQLPQPMFSSSSLFHFTIEPRSRSAAEYRIKQVIVVLFTCAELFGEVGHWSQ